MRAIWALSCAVTALCAAGTAAAQPAVDRARQAYEEAEFRRALELVHEAEDGASLTREGYIRLFETRALAHRALGDDADTDRALAALAEIDPDHRFGREAPPELIERFESVRRERSGPLTVEGRAVPTDTGARVEARVANDDRALVREVRVHARASGGAWQAAPGAVDVATDGAPIEWYAEALGPGGAVLAYVGSAAAPRTLALGGAEEPLETNGASFPWLWVGLGAAAVVGAVVLIVLLSQNDDTQVGARVAW